MQESLAHAAMRERWPDYDWSLASNGSRRLPAGGFDIDTRTAYVRHS